MYVNCKIYVNSNRSHVPIARRRTVIEFAFLFRNPLASDPKRRRLDAPIRELFHRLLLNSLFLRLEQHV